MASTKQAEPKKPSPQEKVDEHRRFCFREVLGEDWPADDINALVKSTSSHHDARRLLERGCPKDLIVQILA